MADKPVGLKQVLAAFQQWLYLPDLGVVEVALATYAANCIPGDPVWLLLTGPSSSGKTEVLNAVLGLPYIREASTLAEAALLSGTPEQECASDAKGGLLCSIGANGILVIKDFTSVLSMSRNARQSVLAALREVYDGKWTRQVGSNGGRELSWKGKLGLIGGVTSQIDSAHSVMSAMGQRFALYRLPGADGLQQARRAIEKTGREKEMRKELGTMVLGFFSGVDLAKIPDLTPGELEAVAAFSALTAACRSAVDRNGASREIDLVHDTEMPARLARMLTQFLGGLQLIGVSLSRRGELIVKIALDCIPPLRRIAFEALLSGGARTTEEIAAPTNYSQQTVRRALDELKCHGVVAHGPKSGPAETWKIEPRWRTQFDLARGAFPKCTG